MAYDTGCVAAPRVAMFSTPDKTYLGKALGSASTDNVSKIKESLVRGELDGVGWGAIIDHAHTVVVGA